MGEQVETAIAKTILLIHSEANVREVVQSCLTDFGRWQVVSTGSPADGLRRARLEQPDAIILDLSLSGMNNFTFLEQLRRQPTTQTIPVILLSTGAKWMDARQLRQFQVSGVVGYCADLIDLSGQIAQLLGWEIQHFLDSDG